MPESRYPQFARDLPVRFVRCELVPAACRDHSEMSLAAAPVRASASPNSAGRLGPLELVRRGGQDPVSVPPGVDHGGRRCPCRHRPRPGRRTRTGPAAPAAVRRPLGHDGHRGHLQDELPAAAPALLDRQAFGRLAVVRLRPPTGPCSTRPGGTAPRPPVEPIPPCGRRAGVTALTAPRDRPLRQRSAGC